MSTIDGLLPEQMKEGKTRSTPKLPMVRARAEVLLNFIQVLFTSFSGPKFGQEQLQFSGTTLELTTEIHLL